MNICQNCFLPLQNPGKCPSCGFDPSSVRKYEGVIQPGIQIGNGRYTVGRVLGRGGFGITYKAKNNATGRIVAVKEYMPSEYSSRPSGSLTVIPYDNEKSRRIFKHGKEKFIDEAKTLVQLRNNPIVVDILDYFEENNTAYLVMQFLDGKDLRTIARNSAGGRIDPEFATECFVTVASCLAEVHKLNILHRDISPENIIVSPDKKIITLIDFGAARSFVSSQNKGMSILLKVGYAPPEQYNSKGNQGPWSDVYALCATYYNIVSGKAPTDSMFRYRGQHMPTLDEMGCNVYPGMSAIIDKGMSLDVKDRYKDFMELLNAVSKVMPIQQAQSQKSEPSGQKKIPPNGNGNFGSQNGGLHGGFGGQNGNFVSNGGSAQGGRIGYNNGSLQGAKFGPNQGVIQSASKQKIPYITFVSSGISSNIGSRDIFKIGRTGQGCNMSLSGSIISRIHCYLTFDGNNFRLTDVSSNGTFLENGERLVKEREYILPPGSKFYIAERENMFIVNCR